jgi:hypothetical protein
MEGKKIFNIEGIEYERTEDDEKFYFKEISDRKNKVHFTMTKDKEKIKEPEYGLKVFWTEVFGD